MGSDGYFDGNTLHMSWEPVPNGKSYSIIVKKCEDDNGYDVCHQIFSKIVKIQTELVETSEQFSDCTTYQLKVSIMYGMFRIL